MSNSIVQDEGALRRLAAIYCSYVDDGEAEKMAALFAPGGKLVVYRPGAKLGQDPPLRTWEGVDGFAKLIDALGQSYARWVHFLGNHWVDISGDRASGETYTIASYLRETEQGNVEEVNLIRYRDFYLRTDVGWRFEARHAFRQWGSIRPVNGAAHELDAVVHGRS